MLTTTTTTTTTETNTTRQTRHSSKSQREIATDLAVTGQSVSNNEKKESSTTPSKN